METRNALLKAQAGAGRSKEVRKLPERGEKAEREDPLSGKAGEIRPKEDDPGTQEDLGQDVEDTEAIRAESRLVSAAA